MRFASTSEILDYVRSHPDCVTADIVEEFYPRSTTLPSDRVAELKPINQWRIAFDSMAYREPLEKGLKMMDRSGVNLRHKVEAYVYVHDGTQVDDAVERCNILRSYGVMPYPMFNRHAKRTQAMTDLKRWTRPWIFYSTEWTDYRRGQ